MKKETKKLLESLKQTMSELRSRLYDAVGLAVEILQDRDWIAEMHNGDEDKAIAYLQAEYFGMVSGTVSLYMLLATFRRYDEPTWRENDFNPSTMVAMFQAEREQEERPKISQQRVKRSEFEAVQERVEELQYKVGRAELEKSQRDHEIEKLKLRIRELEDENRMLREKLEAIGSKREAMAAA